MTWTIAVASELKVVGYNPENADLDRPRGEIIAPVFYLEATNERGDRRIYGGWETQEQAEATWAPFKLIDPRNWHIEEWPLGRPVYGSKAWAEYGEEEQRESERRQDDADAMGFDTRFEIF